MFRNGKHIYGNEEVLVPSHLNFGKYILSFLKKKNDETALVDAETGKIWSYKQVTQYSVSMCLKLTALGIGKGDVVALASENRVDYVPTGLGIIMTGATYTSLGVSPGRANILHVFNLTKPNYLVCSETFWNTNKEVLKSVNGIRLFILFDGNDEMTKEHPRLIRVVTGEVNVDEFEPAPVEGLEDTAVILFSSGTTGLPKGVMLTHMNCITSTDTDLFADKGLKTIGVLGFFQHNYDFFMTMKGFKLGCRIVFHQDSVKLFNYIDEWEIDITTSTPSLMNTLIKDNAFTTKSMKSLKYIYCRSSVLHSETAAEIKRKLPNIKMLVVGLGMTECGEPASCFWSKKGQRQGSAGNLAPGIVMKVVNMETEELLGPNEKGEIRVKGPQLMKGYIDIEPTSYLDSEGFYKTGDLGYYDEDGYVYVIDRIKDIINHCGFKYSPQNIENVILKHPAILEVSVVAKPDPVMVENAFAFIVKKPGFEVTEKEIFDFMKPELSKGELLHGGMRFIEKLPRNARGKVLRAELRKMLS